MIACTVLYIGVALVLLAMMKYSTFSGTNAEASGLLHIDLVRPQPESRVRKIEIRGTGRASVRELHLATDKSRA